MWSGLAWPSKEWRSIVRSLAVLAEVRDGVVSLVLIGYTRSWNEARPSVSRTAGRGGVRTNGTILAGTFTTQLDTCPCRTAQGRSGQLGQPVASRGAPRHDHDAPRLVPPEQVAQPGP